ncbi:ester cyclase [Streptomyces sp. JH002]|uniref:ester cyclase n=1 Tax=Streptomyces TaxID=1883 RepID=UPI00369F4747
MTFVQVIDLKTTRVGEMNRLMDRWTEATRGKRTATHSIVGKDRSDSTHVVEIVEFPSYEEAMRNSKLPETDRIFKEMMELCDDVPRFTDLDVVRDEQLNKRAVRAFFETVINDRRLEAADGFMSPDYADHDPGNPADPHGLREFKEQVGMYMSAFEPVIVIENQIAEGDLVTTRWTVTGTHSGEYLGLEPTGRALTITGHTTFRFADGKIAEGWWNWDQLGVMSQLGLVET